VLPLFHQVSVTLAVVLAPELPLPAFELPPLAVFVVLLLLHAAIVTAAATAIVMTAAFLEPRMGSHLLMMPGFLMMAGARQTHLTIGARGFLRISLRMSSSERF
jgi:hypothetical protein